MTKVEIVGPIGVEQHVLINGITDQKLTQHNKDIAAHILVLRPLLTSTRIGFPLSSS